ncbi:MAG: TIGR02757 family protein [Balneolaceae bacterium]
MKKKKKLKTLSSKKLLLIKPYMDDLVSKIEQPTFIDNDPVQFMHAFEDKNDMELAGFFAAIMAWGRRDIVVAKVDELLNNMNYRPAEFIGNFTESDLDTFANFKHRTFKPIDVYWLIKILQQILNKYGDFEQFWKFCQIKAVEQQRELLAIFNEEFFSLQPETPQRTGKHISNPEKNSSCKRLNMYLRWCIRKSSVDLGTMDFITPAELHIPLDVHVARQARKLGLLSRTQNDWKAVLELNTRLKILNPTDPTAYDFALFGIGVLKDSIPAEFIVNKVD